MNERIKDLMGKTLDKHFSYTWTTMDYNDVSKFSEKFAELIVRECARYFNENYQRDFDTLWREDLTKGIKEHFGVAE